MRAPPNVLDIWELNEYSGALWELNEYSGALWELNEYSGALWELNEYSGALWELNGYLSAPMDTLSSYKTFSHKPTQNFRGNFL
jgi:CYTH domain-containing protein